MERRHKAGTCRWSGCVEAGDSVVVTLFEAGVRSPHSIVRFCSINHASLWLNTRWHSDIEAEFMRNLREAGVEIKKGE